MVVKYIQIVGNDGSYILHKELGTSIEAKQPNVPVGDTISFEGIGCFKIQHREHQYRPWQYTLYIFVVPEKPWFDVKKMKRIK